MNEVKDSIANATTIAGAGSLIMNWNEILTAVLIVSGIVLNIQRIMANKKKKED